jgi:hypothetical protein
MNDEFNIPPEPKATPRGGDGHGWGGVDTLGLASGDWVVDDGGTGLSQNAEPARTQTGEPIPAQIAITDTRKSGSITYRANKVGAVTPFALTLGKEYNGYAVTGATLNGSQGWTTIVVQYHMHTDTQVGHMTNEKAITWPSGVLGYGAFGVLGSNFDTAEIQSCSFSVSIDHTDRNTNVGQHLVGRSHGITYAASETAVTDKDADDVTFGADWIYTSVSPRRPSGNFWEVTASATKFEAASGGA